MKKSYLMLGLVAVALSSCSSDKIDSPSVGNESNATKGLQPIVLGMSTSIADVEVGTRGTGTVGSTDAAKNEWQYEDLYVLMTSSDTLCLEDADCTVGADGKKTGWGFTSVRGAGPFLKHQFDGKFWARPTTSRVENGVNYWKLNYEIDENEWWDGLPIDKFYPMQGKSQFFAFYIDDACDSTECAPYAGTAAPNVQTFNHDHPAYKKDLKDSTMSIKFHINGSQDLMFGTADASKTAGKLGFSAQSARAGIVPAIKMSHLLSRLTFTVIKGAESTNMVLLDSIGVLSASKGSMVVAYKNAPKDTLTWENVKDEQKDTFKLMEMAPTKYIKNVDGLCMTEDDYEIEVPLSTYDDATSTWNPTGEEVAAYYAGIVNGAHAFRAGSKGGSWLLKGINVAPADWDVFMTKVVELQTNATEESGKNKLAKFSSIALGDVLANVNDSIAVGEAMFVQPGVEEYQMFVYMTMAIRDEWTDAEKNKHQALTEKIVLPLNLKVNGGFKAGKSYNVMITVYGLEKVVVEAILTGWEQGEDIPVGSDDEYDEEGNAKW